MQREYRSCTYCLLTCCIEDKFHAFFQCGLYVESDTIQPTDLYNTISLFDFYNVLGQSECKVIRNISNFIFSMFKKEIVSQYYKKNQLNPLCYIGYITCLTFLKRVSGLHLSYYVISEL